MDIDRLAELIEEKFEKVYDKIDAKVGAVHERVTASGKEQTAELHAVTNDQNLRIGALHTALEAHKAAPCASVEKHEQKYHGSSKMLGRIKDAKTNGTNTWLNRNLIKIIIALITLAGTLAGIIAASMSGRGARVQSPVKIEDKK